MKAKCNISHILTLIFLGAISTAVTVEAAPQINSLSGDYAEGALVTLNGSSFSAKANAKPYFYWSADDGLEPSPLGRQQSWGSTFSGERVSGAGAVIAPGSTHAVRLDHGASEAAALARVEFDSDQLYVWRKRYDDFDVNSAFAIRTRYSNLQVTAAGSAAGYVHGDQPVAGMLMRHRDNYTVTGKVASVSTGTHNTITYTTDFGSVPNPETALDVNQNDTLYFYSASDTTFSTPLMSVQTDEGYGILYTFNHKIIRLWGKYGQELNTTYINLGDRQESLLHMGSAMVSEHTQVATLDQSQWDQPLDHASRHWATEELQYQNSSAPDAIDGLLTFWQNGIRGWSPDKKFRFRTTAHPVSYSQLYQAQVSNGAQLGSYEYYDSLYVDDSWHRVLLCSSNKFSSCNDSEVQIPTVWDDGQLKFRARVKPFQSVDRLYVYVVDGEGNVNEDGYPYYCARCPKPPSFTVN